MNHDDLMALLFELEVQRQERILEWEFKTLQAVVGDLSTEQIERICKAIRKEPHLSVGEAYMDR